MFRQDQGLEFDVKYHISHVFRTSTHFKENFSDGFKDIHKLKFLKNFVTLLIHTPPRNDIRLTSQFVKKLHFMKIIKMIRGFCLNP